MTEYIVAFETTPYEVAKVAGGFAVRQAYWDKIVSPVYATRAEADAALRGPLDRYATPTYM